MSTMELKTTPRRIKRTSKAAARNRVLIESLNMTDETAAANLGVTKRVVQMWLAGAEMREETRLLLQALRKGKVDLRSLRRELGLKVY